MAKKKTIKNENGEILHPVTDVTAVEGLNEALAAKQDVLQSGENIKTINGESILGSGNIIVDGGGSTISVDSEMSETSENPVQNKVITQAVNAKYTKPAGGIPASDLAPGTTLSFKPFNASWPTDTTLEAFCAAVMADSSADVGMSYYGGLSCSGLPTGMIQGDVIVEILGESNNKVIKLEMSSTEVAPYNWEGSYWADTFTGWKSWQEKLVSGENIKTVNGTSLLGSGNIQAGEPNAVKFTEQSLTDPQKTQARENIGAGTYSKAGTGIPKTDLASDVQESLGAADTAYQKPGTGIPSTDMASGVQTSLGKADTAYQKPGTGVPKTDMESAVQISLGKADTAYQKPVGGIPKSDLDSGVQQSLDLADSAVQADPVGSVTPPVDPSAWATAEEVDELELKVDDFAIPMTANKTVTLGGTIGATLTLTMNNEAGWWCAIFDCSEGDVFIVNGKGGNNTRLWGFVDANNKLLSVSASGATGTNTQVVAPTNAVKFVTNTNISATSYYRKKNNLQYLKERVDVIEVATDGNTEKLRKRNYLDGYYTTTTGVSANADYIVTEKIPGSEGEVVAISGTGATGRYALAYDADGGLLAYRSQAYQFFTLPAGTVSFVLCFAKTATAFEVYKDNVLVWKKTDAEDSLIEVSQSMEEIEEQLRSTSAYSDELFEEEEVPPLPMLNYDLQSNGKFGSSTSYKHKRMRVFPGDIVRFHNSSMLYNLNLYFLSTYEYTPTAGGDIPVLSGTEMVQICRTGANGYKILQNATVVVPSGCYAIAFSIYSNISPEVYIRRQKLNRIVPHYRQYISDKAFSIRKRDIMLGQNADSFIFFTDYHIPGGESNIITNFQHSPALIEYLIKNTNTKVLMFGGDVFNSPSSDSDRFTLMDAFLKQFSFKPEMFTAIGNHEWRQSSDLDNDGRTYDFGSLAKNLEGIVTFGRDANGDITQPYYFFDNPSLKIRYFVLYTPGTYDSSSYAVFNFTEQLSFLSAKVGELDNTWKVVIMQHIVYENGTEGTSVYDVEGFPTKIGHTIVGNQIIQAITTNNSSNGAKVVCLLSGHIHNEFCEFLDGHCVSICQNCDATFTRYGGNNDVVFPNQTIRDWGSIDEQSFDVYHLDIKNKIVYGTKIGYGADKTINITEQSVAVGSTITLTPSISSVDTWQSQNEDVATVANGVVTGVSAGRATIRAKKAGTPNGEWEYFNIVVS